MKSVERTTCDISYLRWNSVLISSIWITLYLFHSRINGQEWPCTSLTDVEFIGHKTDCRAYFICDRGNASKMYCPAKFAYHQPSLTCVPEDSGMDVNCKYVLKVNLKYYVRRE